MDTLPFEQRIYRNWAAHFGCAPELTLQPGTTLLPEEKLRGEQEISLWYVDRHTFVRFDPALAGLFKTNQGTYAQAALTADALAASLGAKRIEARDRGLALYLQPEDLPACTPSAPYSLRPLTLADAGALVGLKGHLTSVEVDEGFVEVDHLIAFGCFTGTQMVAAASGYEMAGFLDLGVLTHAGFRRQGLGKAVVGALCAWAGEHGYLAQYRHDVNNTGSAQLAHSLNFKPYVQEETLWIK
jgi:GNAT superfamily N-acetyltransferase